MKGGQLKTKKRKLEKKAHGGHFFWTRKTKQTSNNDVKEEDDGEEGFFYGQRPGFLPGLGPENAANEDSFNNSNNVGSSSFHQTSERTKSLNNASDQKSTFRQRVAQKAKTVSKSVGVGVHSLRNKLFTRKKTQDWNAGEDRRATGTSDDTGSSYFNRMFTRKKRNGSSENKKTFGERIGQKAKTVSRNIGVGVSSLRNKVFARSEIKTNDKYFDDFDDIQAPKIHGNKKFDKFDLEFYDDDDYHVDHHRFNQFAL